MSRRIEVSVGHVSAIFALAEDWAPQTTALLWEILPVDNAELRHGKLSGEAVFFDVDHPRLRELPVRNELGVSSIYKGFMVAHLRPERASFELLISYGLAEYRWPDGRRQVTPVAEVEGESAPLFTEFARTWTHGATRINVRRA